MTEGVTGRDALDIVKVVFVSFAPPAVSFGGAVAGAYAVDRLIHAATPRETLDWLVTVIVIWLLIPTLQFAVASSAMRISIYSRRAMRLAPWLLAAGFVASLISIQFYGPFLNAFKEGWREMTVFITFTPMLLTYITATNRLIAD
jgi:hypothetical protein